MLLNHRSHLFEFEDLPWLPGFIRRGITDLLEYQLNRYRVYDSLAPKLAALVEEQGLEAELIDLCSGSAGPIRRMSSLLQSQTGRAPRVLLTDKFPNLQAFERTCQASGGRIRYVSEPVDAADVPAHLTGLRTIFTAFHHFRPMAARSILEDAAAKRAPIAVFEFTSRTWANLLKAALLSPLLVWVDTLAIRPFSFSRLLFTYVLPVIPLCYAWDAFASHYRTYSERELHELVAGLPSDGYKWEIGQKHSPESGFVLTFLVGRPVTVFSKGGSERDREMRSGDGQSVAANPMPREKLLPMTLPAAAVAPF